MAADKKLREDYDKISDQNQIQVTHFINPNKFYFVYTNVILKRQMLKIQMEAEINQFLNNQRLPDEHNEPEVGKVK